MNPNDVLAAAAWGGSAGTAVGIAVQLVKNFAGVDSPRAKVAAATISSTVLVVAYAIQSSIPLASQPFTLLLAVLTIAATGAGIQTAVSASVTGRAQNPTP